MIVGYARADLGVIGLRDVIHLRSSARVTHRQIILGTVSGAIGAFAPGFAATLVALDERAPEDGLQWWQFPQQLLAVSSEDGRGFVGHPNQTTYITGPIIIGARSFGKILLGSTGKLFRQRDQIEQQLNIQSP